MPPAVSAHACCMCVTARSLGRRVSDILGSCLLFPPPMSTRGLHLHLCLSFPCSLLPCLPPSKPRNSGFRGPSQVSMWQRLRDPRLNVTRHVPTHCLPSMIISTSLSHSVSVSLLSCWCCPWPSLPSGPTIFHNLSSCVLCPHHLSLASPLCPIVRRHCRVTTLN
jgi:hypothetical protein